MFNFFNKDNKIKTALTKTAQGFFKGIFNLNSAVLDEFELEDIETTLIKADLGVDLSVEIVDRIKEKKVKSNELKNFLKQEFCSILDSIDNYKLKFDSNKLNVYFVVGVNGAGKTTLIGKLASRFKKQNLKVLLVAGDTFRAAAQEQLDIWAKRAGVDILIEKIPPAALAYKGIDLAKSENYDVVIIDSAGRLQNKYNLIEELKKIKNVIVDKTKNDNLETILVLDGTQGQNGISQANVFFEAVKIDSCAITKLDGSPKGGIVLAIANELKLPCKLIGVGEKIEDLIDFNKEEFIEALFEQ